MSINHWNVATILAMTGAMALGEEPIPPKFERTVIDANFPGGYQVEVADVNGDKKPDIVALGGSTLAWYENPTWTKRVVSTSKQTPEIISSATADLDGDGKAEIAIAYDFAMNEPKRGKLLLAIQGEKPDDPWTFKPIIIANAFPGTGGGSFAGGGSITAADRLSGRYPVTTESMPSIHRLRWGWVIGKPVLGLSSVSFQKTLELVVAPIFGPSAKPPAFDQEPASLLLFDIGAEPKSGRWTLSTIGKAPVLHAIEVINLENTDGPSVVLGASNVGVTEFRRVAIAGAPIFQPQPLVPGAPGESPKKGSSEVHLGKFKDGRKFLSTVEPWHGTDVAIYESESLKPLKFGPRTVIDTTLKDGHALWVADVDGDGDDEVFAGFRGGTGGVLMFDHNGKTWDRTILDPGVTAQDLRGGDIDGDGTPDVVAIGGKSHNVVWYRPIRPSK